MGGVHYHRIRPGERGVGVQKGFDRQKENIRGFRKTQHSVDTSF